MRDGEGEGGGGGGERWGNKFLVVADGTGTGTRLIEEAGWCISNDFRVFLSSFDSLFSNS